MLGDLPPSSSVTGIRFSEAYCMISRPVVVSPVKATFATRGLWASGLPASTPKPCTTFTTPLGRMSAMSSISAMIDTGVCSAGLSTTQFPAASAGASFQVAIKQREVPGDDLPHDAERLVEVVGDGVVVELRDVRPPAPGCSPRNSGSGPPPAAGRPPVVSRIGLPLSSVSMKARVSRLASIRSAMRLRMLAR